MTNEQKITKIAKHFSEIMVTLGLDLTDDSLKDTPKRVAKMYVNELCSALTEPPPPATMFENPYGDNLLVEKNIWFASLCEHHFLPFIGFCHVAYIPTEKIVGISKIHRTVKYYASKPQVQERLIGEIGQRLQTVLNTENVAVIMDAKHLCAHIRGVKDFNSSTVNSFLGGVFIEPDLRSEFLRLIKL